VTSEAEKEEVEESFERGGEIGRRKLLTRMLGLAAAALGVAAVFPIRSLGPSPGKSLERTPWRSGSRLVGEDGNPIRVEDVPIGGMFTVYPEGHVGSADGQTVLVRVPADANRPRPGREAWAPNGYLAYNKVCTHAGCPVGLYQVETHQLLCPCHQSAFDVLDGAKPVFGPATRSLPQLPLQVDGQGFLVARSDYPEPIGPAYWNRR
jgi:ubiquinol-cytochrome c reductase iron-sulfur subunit